MTEQPFVDYEANYRTFEKLEKGLLPRNKEVLFEAFTAARIASVTVTFDGCGDSGQMEDMSAVDLNDMTVSIPEWTINTRRADFHGLTVKEEATTVEDFIETLCYDLLSKRQNGWENGDGAYGQIIFTTAQRAIRIEFHERYTETNYYEYDF